MSGRHRAARAPRPQRSLRDHFWWTFTAASLVLGAVILTSGFVHRNPPPPQTDAMARSSEIVAILAATAIDKADPAARAVTP